MDHQANLPAKFISRQKLCLSATTEYWVNDAAGLPVMMVTGELTEKLQHAIEQYIIPAVTKNRIASISLFGCRGRKNTSSKPSAKPQMSHLYAPLSLTGKLTNLPSLNVLWDQYRIAVITYRKNVQDKWAEQSFKSTDVRVLDNTITMQICEQQTELGGVKFREIRRLTDSGHQTAIITTNNVISTAVAAGRMFGRWSQENFFRYMIMDYDFDKMIEFGTEAIDENKEVVNPQYRQLTHRLKKEKEKTARLKAKLYPLTEQSIEADLEEIPELAAKQMKLLEQIEIQQQTEQQIQEQRSKISPRIKLKTCLSKTAITNSNRKARC